MVLTLSLFSLPGCLVTYGWGGHPSAFPLRPILDVVGFGNIASCHVTANYARYAKNFLSEPGLNSLKILQAKSIL